MTNEDARSGCGEVRDDKRGKKEGREIKCKNGITKGAEKEGAKRWVRKTGKGRGSEDVYDIGLL